MKKLDWNYITPAREMENLNIIAMDLIRMIVQECTSLDESEKVAEIDGVISLVDAVAESMKGDEDA